MDQNLSSKAPCFLPPLIPTHCPCPSQAPASLLDLLTPALQLLFKKTCEFKELNFYEHVTGTDQTQQETKNPAGGERVCMIPALKHRGRCSGYGNGETSL
ncbi:ubiquitin carboxyl-terminal hydrolase 12 [Platysternon megacephalum]|uniref:Ubiquitin carboxyl-terminal hydrolase 12 n=1 Tax=Platysternon megacephalum TaxID=55544 RepID=A0A4D9DIK9_9SAUR|nr:ubiquitin carboxyl-terminal hydrolase 12 [Platysternon megacephalum]